MKISNNSRKLLVDEIEYIVEQMKNAEDINKLLYFFSAIYGIIQRVYNIEYNEDLVFAHFVLRSTHEQFLMRYKAIKQQRDTAVLIHQEQFEKLIKLSEEFGKKIKEQKRIDSILKHFTILITSTTGNGYYLMQKGLLRI